MGEEEGEKKDAGWQWPRVAERGDTAVGSHC